MKNKLILLLIAIICFLSACSNYFGEAVSNDDNMDDDFFYDEIIGIPGSKIFDVEELLISQIDFYENGNVTINSESFNIYSYNFEVDDLGELIMATFIISDSKILDNDRFIADAKELFFYCIRLPYDSSDIDRAQLFIEENIPMEMEPNSEEKTEIVIGDARFILYGTKVGEEYSLFQLTIAVKTLNIS